MTSEDFSKNPVLLWGDLGPDVYRLSQIFHPDQDRYVKTQDTVVVSGKDYYEAKNLILTTDVVVVSGKTYYERVIDDTKTRISYVEVTDIDPTCDPKSEGYYQSTTDKVQVFSWVGESPAGNPNPYANGWYEVNPDAVEQSGKFVPAIDALVIVDETDCKYKATYGYKTRQLLAVKSIDVDLRVTFATIHFGDDTESSPRSIDYGNERFMLFIDRNTAPSGNIYLTPDRKLMLYGGQNLSYGYRLTRNGKVISANIPTIQEKANAFIPYARASAKRITFVDEKFADYKNQWADVLLENGMQRTLQIPSDTSTYVSTFDLEFKQGTTYYIYDEEESTHYRALIPKSTSVTEWDYENGENISEWVNALEGRTRPCQKILDAIRNRRAYIYDNPTDTSSHVFMPDRCYLQTGLSITSGETINMEVYEYDDEDDMVNLVMNITIIAREATALDRADVTSRQIVDFDVEFNGSDQVSDVWYVQQNCDPTEFTYKCKIRFDDGCDQVVPIDNMTCFMYGHKDIKTGVPGREFPILFKFFPVQGTNVNWEAVSSTPTRNVLTCRKIVKVINNLSEKIRKISFIPTVNCIIENPSISSARNCKYKFNYLCYRNDSEQPVFNHLVPSINNTWFVHTEDVKIVDGKKYYRRYHNDRYEEVANLSLTYAGRLVSEIEGILGYQLYVEEECPTLGFTSIDHLKSSGKAEVITEQLASSNFNDVMHARIVARICNEHNLTEVYQQDVAFLLNSPTDNGENMKFAIGDDCTGYEKTALPYGSTPIRPYLLYKDNEVEGKVTHTFQVCSDKFASKAEFLSRFYYDAVGTTWAEPTHFLIRPVDITYDYANHERVQSDFVSIAENLYEPVVIYTTKETEEVVDEVKTGRYIVEKVATELNTAADSVGGSIPCKLSTSNLVRGIVVVEFYHYDVDTQTYKCLYGVPVDTKLEGWPVE